MPSAILLSDLELMRGKSGSIDNFIFGHLVKSLVSSAASAAARPVLDAVRALRGGQGSALPMPIPEGLTVTLLPNHPSLHGMAVSNGGRSILVVVATGNHVAPEDRKFERLALGDFIKEASDEELDRDLETRADTIRAVKLYTTWNVKAAWNEIIKASGRWSPSLLAHCPSPSREIDGQPQMRPNVTLGHIDDWHKVFPLLERAMDALGHGGAYREYAREDAQRVYADIYDDSLASYRACERICDTLIQADRGIPNLATIDFIQHLERNRIEADLRSITARRLPEVVSMLQSTGRIGDRSNATDHSDGRVRAWIESAASSGGIAAVGFQSQSGNYLARYSPGDLQVHKFSANARPEELSRGSNTAPWLSASLRDGAWRVHDDYRGFLDMDSIRHWSDFVSLVESSHCSLEEDIHESIDTPPPHEPEGEAPSL